MSKLVLAGLAACVSLTACAATQKSDQVQAPVTAIAPLVDLYDSAWINGQSGELKTLGQVADDLAGYDVVFFGEFHGHSGIHLAQMRLFRALHERNPVMTLSLEQFERDTQALVDDYLEGEIGEKTLQEDARGWDNYEQSYRPLVEYAKDKQLPVVASNAPKSAVICVGKEGPGIIEKMPQPDRSWVAKDLHVEEGAYMDKYKSFIGSSSTHGKSGHGGESDPEADARMAKIMEAMTMKSFSAQVTRDDTMAESIAMHLQSNPGRKVFHLDGNFHSASHLGTVERLKMRMPELKLAVINPIAAEDNNAPALSDEDAATGDYIILVRQVPEMFVSDERELEYQRKVIKKRMGNKCVYSQETAQHEEKS